MNLEDKPYLGSPPSGSPPRDSRQASNPYAPPQSLAQPTIVVAQRADEFDGPLVHVEGEFLIVPQRALLPRLCVKTGVPVSHSDMRDARLIARRYEFHHPNRSVCEIRFGLAPHLRRRYEMKSLALVVLVGLFLLACCWMATLETFHWIGGYGATIGFALSMVALFRLPPILRAEALPAGGFRIVGCGPEFLERMRSI